MRIRQVPPHERWPSGDSRDLAEIRFSPDELCARYGLSFEDDYDDLDWFKLAAIEASDSSQIWFYKYRGDQLAGTVIRVDAGADLAEAKVQLKQSLDLTDDDFVWVAPGAEASAALA